MEFDRKVILVLFLTAFYILIGWVIIEPVLAANAKTSEDLAFYNFIAAYNQIGLRKYISSGGTLVPEKDYLEKARTLEKRNIPLKAEKTPLSNEKGGQNGAGEQKIETLKSNDTARKTTCSKNVINEKIDIAALEADEEEDLKEKESTPPSDIERMAISKEAARLAGQALQERSDFMKKAYERAKEKYAATNRKKTAQGATTACTGGAISIESGRVLCPAIGTATGTGPSIVEKARKEIEKEEKKTKPAEKKEGKHRSNATGSVLKKEEHAEIVTLLPPVPPAPIQEEPSKKIEEKPFVSTGTVINTPDPKLIEARSVFVNAMAYRAQFNGQLFEGSDLAIRSAVSERVELGFQKREITGMRATNPARFDMKYSFGNGLMVGGIAPLSEGGGVLEHSSCAYIMKDFGKYYIGGGINPDGDNKATFLGEGGGSKNFGLIGARLPYKNETFLLDYNGYGGAIGWRHDLGDDSSFDVNLMEEKLLTNGLDPKNIGISFRLNLKIGEGSKKK